MGVCQLDNKRDIDYLMALIKFAYYRESALDGCSSSLDLLNVLVLADRFQMNAAITACSDRLTRAPDLSISICCQYLQLPESIISNKGNKGCQDLLHKCKSFLSDHFKVKWGVAPPHNPHAHCIPMHICWAAQRAPFISLTCRVCLTTRLLTSAGSRMCFSRCQIIILSVI